MKELPKWAMGGPFRVYSRVEAMEQARMERTLESRQERAARKLKELFKEAPSVEDNK